MNSPSEVAVFGGGCFWCTEAVFSMLRGVVSVKPGYAGGSTAHPTYEQVSSGTTGHAEVIQFEFDPKLISYRDLLDVFFATHDPTTENRQGNDVGPQYRSVIFVASPQQRAEAEAYIGELAASAQYEVPIVTRIEQLMTFWPAEDYHVQYYEHHKNQPYCTSVIAPKVQKTAKLFERLLADRNPQSHAGRGVM